MRTSYNRLWKLLIDRRMSPHALQIAAGISPNTMTKFRKNQEVSMVVLMKVCGVLGANIGDVMDFVEDTDGCD